MPIRDNFPKAQLPRSHYFFSVGRGDSLRTFALRPVTLWTIIALFPISLLWGGAATLYFAFHDDMIGVYLTHQAEMQTAYEDRIAEARAEVDRFSSRQLLDQNALDTPRGLRVVTLRVPVTPEFLATHGVWLRMMVASILRPLLRSVAPSGGRGACSY